MVLANNEESLGESNDSDEENQQEIKHVVHDDEDGFNERRDFGDETHVVQRFEPHAEDKDRLNDSNFRCSETGKLVDKSHEVGDDDNEIHDTPNSGASCQTQAFCLKQEHYSVKNIENSTKDDCSVWEMSYLIKL